MNALSVMVLTGCASGIGRHLAGALSRRGHRVLATDLDERTLAARAEEDCWDKQRVRLARLDVRRAEEWEAALDLAEKELGGMDVLMNVAGALRPGWVQEITPADIDLHIDVNVKGTMLGTHAAAVRMVRRGAGHIVNFGSLASLAPVPGLALYAASKFAVRGFSLAAATELRPRGVAVTLVMPDAVQTPMLDLQVDYEQAAMTFSGPRALTVEDIEAVVLNEVLPGRPLEVALPLSRGLLARVANTAPGLSRVIAPVLRKKGLQKQERIKGGKPA
ncbi:SDR family oxidoreductase [Polyangium aurulentum]|uniref:SDR family oxidoreductase n=1 Tax=Polyangium aurulentum TaxID=2567896 RepID=UPI0010AE6A28|nr:SDR family NAD(P)-dependent oxidoreductase [Polyangium aurulentum]UQA58283.1 SDR family NAD(P)-dependent oxidoreductase [Polyangium aurulentum]